MPRVKITNLKAGACVINSLRLTIAGKSSVVRDASILGDPDLVELETDGIISVENMDDPKPPALPQTPRAAVKPPAQPQGKKSVAKKGAKQGQANPQQQPQQVKPPKPQPPKERPGTSFRIPDGPEDEMGGKVVVMGEDGPVVRKMNQGINSTGPKFAGDPFDDAADSEPDVPPEGFTEIQ